jgi:hypothetical protein
VIPITYPNIAQAMNASDSSDNVKVNNSGVLRKGDKISMSNGDNAGVAGGVVSSKFMDKVEIKVGWPTVKADQKEIAFHLCTTGQNGDGSVNIVGAHTVLSQAKAWVQVSPGMSLAQGPKPAQGNKIEASHWEFNDDILAAYDSTDLFDSDCTSVNGKSESWDTASDEVKKWFTDRKVPDQYRNSTLGKDGGGGFIQGSTKVTKIPKGTIVFRWYGGASVPLGAWWFRHPVQDPIRDAALPPHATAKHMLVCRTKEDLEVLSGPGAPRCSNKPGGPEQLCFPRHDDGWLAVVDILTI